MSQQINHIKGLSYYLDIIKRSIRGEEMDYTTGSIRRAVIMLAIPMILEMSMESVFAVVDMFFVGKLGEHAIQTVGLTESVITIVYSLAIGISMAATAVVARRIGEKNPEGAADAAVQSIILALFVTLLFSVPGFIFARNILRLMGGDVETVSKGVHYTRLMYGGSIVIMMLFLINGIFRGAGNAAMAMKSLWVANTCNIILCPLLIYGAGPIPAFGLTGAAMATTTGRGIGVIYQLYHLFKGKSLVKIKWSAIRFNGPVVRSLADIASTGTIQFIIASCSWIILTKLVADHGGAFASAGYQIAIRVIVFFILPAWGLSNAAATLVGQNLGANQPERAERSVMKTAQYNALFMGAVTLFFLLGAEWIVSIFTAQPEVKRYAVQALRIISAGYIFYGIGMVMANAFNGAGDTRTPTWINFFGFWIFQIPFAYWLALSFHLGPTGGFIAVPVAESAIALAAFVLFKKGTWKKVKV